MSGEIHWPFGLPPFEELPEELQQAGEDVRREAENACQHRFDLLGSGPVELGEAIDWHRDFKSGYVWPRQFYQTLAVTRLTDTSDAKVPWELSRCHHLLALARAACLFSEPRYAEELGHQFVDWIASNPPGVGINWVNTMEVGIRAVNWVWALGTLEQYRPLESAVRRQIIESLEVHGRHIARNLEGSPYLRSNHYLGDILGLLAVGYVFRGDRRGMRWFSRARQGFEREIRSQVLDDGVGFEASTAYHGLVLEMFTVARWLCWQAGRPLSAAYDNCLTRMLTFSRAIRQPDGEVPLFGDNDSGRVLPATSRRTPTHDHVLSLGAAILGQELTPSAALHPEVAWTFGIEAWKQLRVARDPSRSAVASAFREGGYYVLADEHIHLVARCGDVGQNGNGGHAHNDLLSFVLSLKEPIIVDSGLGDYTGDPASRNEARSTSAHNTVKVAGEEINPIIPDSLFELRQVALSVVEHWQPGEAQSQLTISHDGYRLLPQRVTHRRSIRVDHTAARVWIEDELLGHGSCSAETFLHLAPSLTISRSSATCIRLTSPCGEGINLMWRGPELLVLRKGRVCPRYGVYHDATIVTATITGSLPLRFGWELSLAAQAQCSPSSSTELPRE